MLDRGRRVELQGIAASLREIGKAAADLDKDQAYGACRTAWEVIKDLRIGLDLLNQDTKDFSVARRHVENASDGKHNPFDGLLNASKIADLLERALLAPESEQPAGAATEPLGKKKIFVCHASEDKASVVTPLVNELRRRGESVWFDKFELKLGDSLSEKIAEGLRECQYGVVVLSKSFFSKKWPKAELDGMTTKEMTEGKKVILPVWHQVDQGEVANFSLLLAGRFAVSTALGIEHVAEEIQRAVGASPIILTAGAVVPVTSPGNLDVTLGYKPFETRSERHIYSLVVSVNNQTSRAFERVRVQARLPNFREPVHLSGVRKVQDAIFVPRPYVAWEYEPPFDLYPGESLDVFTVDGAHVIRYDMDNDLYQRGDIFKYDIAVRVLIPTAAPILLSKSFREMQNF